MIYSYLLYTLYAGITVSAIRKTYNYFNKKNEVFGKYEINEHDKKKTNIIDQIDINQMQLKKQLNNEIIKRYNKKHLNNDDNINNKKMDNQYYISQVQKVSDNKFLYENNTVDNLDKKIIHNKNKIHDIIKNKKYKLKHINNDDMNFNKFKNINKINDIIKHKRYKLRHIDNKDVNINKSASVQFNNIDDIHIHIMKQITKKFESLNYSDTSDNSDILNYSDTFD